MVRVAPRRILLLTPIAPAPSGNGLAMRAALAVRGLAQAGELWTAIVPVAGPAPSDASLAWSAERSAHVVSVPPACGKEAARGWLSDPLGRRIAGEAGALPALARAASPAVGAALLEALGEPAFDVVFVLRLYLVGAAAALLGAGRGAYRVLDSDDDDATTLEAIARLHHERAEPNAARRCAAEAAAFARLASAALPLFDRILAAGVPDARRLAERYALGSRVEVLPNAVAIPRSVPPRDLAGPLRLLFVGNLDYPPNLDAAERLVSVLLPALRERREGARLQIAGSGGGSRLEEWERRPGVEILGAVADLRPLYQRAHAAVVPLRAGGGSRLKLLEAFAHGVPVVASSAAAAGLEVRGGRHLLLADSDAEMVEATLELAAHAELGSRLTREARGYVERHHDLERVAPRLEWIARLPTGRARC